MIYLISRVYINLSLTIGCTRQVRKEAINEEPDEITSLKKQLNKLYDRPFIYSLDLLHDISFVYMYNIALILTTFIYIYMSNEQQCQY